MKVAERISSFIQLGEYLRTFKKSPGNLFLSPLTDAAYRSSIENPWFTPENITTAIGSIGQMLEPVKLHQWLEPYRQKITDNTGPRTIGVVMAGNIPLVGFHDFICVLMSGNRIKAKLSSSDAYLLPAISQMLVQIQPLWKEYLNLTTGKLGEMDAVIATGSANTSRYFEYYFGKYPHIIRNHRNSIAVLNGKETDSVLHDLTKDIMLFFGMGCRSISKLFIPAGYDVEKLKTVLAHYSNYLTHNKYANNYNYQKSILLINNMPFFDAGSILLRNNKSINSPIAVLHFEEYRDQEGLTEAIQADISTIQCIVSESPLPFPSVLPGKAQFPELWDYADQADTMDFLLSCFSK